MNTRDYEKFVLGSYYYNDRIYADVIAKIKYIYLTLAISGEAGELANAIKKLWRDSDDFIDELNREDSYKHILFEIGDIIWYCTYLALMLGSNLDEVMVLNVEKLRCRDINLSEKNEKF